SSPHDQLRMALCTLNILNFSKNDHLSPFQKKPPPPWNQTWMVINVETGNIANVTSSNLAPLGTWFPDLLVDLCDLVGNAWDPSDQEPFPGYGCLTPGGHSNTRSLEFYICLAHWRDRKQIAKCGGPESTYCKAWGCESTGWITGKNMQEVGREYSAFPLATPGGCCNPLVIKFTPVGKKANWEAAKNWGLGLYDPGLIFTIKLVQRPLSKTALGPNQELNPRKQSIQQTSTPNPSLTHFSTTSPSTKTLLLKSTTLPMGTLEDPLLALLKQSHLVLNSSNPNITKSCWLCYDTAPPYYEGIATLGNYTSSHNSNECRWQSKGSLTLQQVTGQGLYIGHIAASHQSLCKQTVTLSNSGQYLIPQQDTWWACSTGLTPCAHTEVISNSQGFCVLVRLVPRLLYHSDEDFYLRLRGSPPRTKREPLMALTLSMILGMGLIGVGTGTASLITQNQHYSGLRAAVDLDIEKQENSISHLQESLTSLAEVVMQKRRGLDLIFLQQGGLCVALGEECCFYVDHSGIIKESMTKVREGLAKRKKGREAQQGWFESWFNSSPWLTTLISTLLGPLIILFLLLTFSPSPPSNWLQGG
uniref:Envelope protein n=1 Tax=Sciurus vulgaris TaxID=55149 RepID=A0A8D2AV23_SCIVU